MIKVLALNSSAWTGGRSKTDRVLSHLVEGMREARAEAENNNLLDK